jgi:hypothetical protein
LLPLEAPAAGYGFSFADGYKKIFDSEIEQNSIFAVHGHLLYARHLITFRRFDEAQKTLDDYPRLWLLYGGELNAYQKMVLHRGLGEIYVAEHRESKNRKDLYAAEGAIWRGLKWAEETKLQKDIELAKTALKELESTWQIYYNERGRKFGWDATR